MGALYNERLGKRKGSESGVVGPLLVVVPR